MISEREDVSRFQSHSESLETVDVSEGSLLQMSPDGCHFLLSNITEEDM